jgi:hypothetical protein
MKANLRRIVALLLPLSLLLTASCAERQVAPAPAPTPVPPPPPPPPPAPAVDWREAPITPGDWQWSMSGGQSVARFADGLLVLRCDQPGATITMLRRGEAAGPVPVTIDTTEVTRPLSGTAQSGPPPAIALTFAVHDPLLDAMAFSRGRFAVEVTGMPTLYVPSWPEVSRVIEDCR